MQKDVENQALLLEKKKHRRRIWRRIVGVLACIVVFCTTYALILPAITMQKYTCGMEEHSHTDECYALAEGSSAENLSCITPESETHTHTDRCYGVWELSCGLEEHTHTESCKPAGLDEAQQAQVNEVIARIDALPTMDEIDAQLETYAEAPDGEEAYLTQVYSDVQAAYKLYVALGADLQGHVTNADKLMELEWIWSATVYDTTTEENTGKTVSDWPTSNHVYVSSLDLTRRTTGEGWFDADATEFAEGLDLSADDNVLRTYDMATYTIDFTTRLRTESEMLEVYREEYRRLNAYKDDVDIETSAANKWAAVENVSGYKNCYAYFEFALPGTAEEVYFETDSMPWLENYGNYYTVRSASLDLDRDGTAENYQILQGRVLLQADGNTVIGASAHQLYFCFRALNLKAEDTLQPRMCISLMYNNAQERMDGNDITHIGTIDAQAFSMPSATSPDGTAVSYANFASGKTLYWKNLTDSQGNPYESQLQAYWDYAKHYRRFVIDDVTVANGGSLTKETSFVSTTHTSCSYCDAEDWDFCEAKGLIFEELEISCAPSYNIAVVTLDKTRTGDFNFRETLNTQAINYDLYQDDNASLQGRLLGYGIRVEIVGQRDKGIRGVELPDPDEELTLEFDFDFASTLKTVDKSISSKDTSYELLYWSGGENMTDPSYDHDGDGVATSLPYDMRSGDPHWFNTDQRPTKYDADSSYRTFINQLPYNRQKSGSGASNDSNCCEEGGYWTFTLNDDGSVHGTVTGAMLVNNTVEFEPELLPDDSQFTGDSNSIMPFPCVPLAYVANNINYYNYKDASGSMMSEYWELGNPAIIDKDDVNVHISDPRIVFSTGEIWLVQPYTGIPESGEDAGVQIASSTLLGSSCDTVVDVAATNMQVYSGTGDTKTLISDVEADDTDGISNKSYTYISPGRIYSYISYCVPDAVGMRPLVGDTYADSDWAVKGQEFVIGAYIAHREAEGDQVGMAYDMLIKLDGDFIGLRDDDDVKYTSGAEFGVHFGEYSASSKLKKNTLYACKPDGTGWASDEEMKQATVDDLIYYDSYDDWVASGDTLVGVLTEIRGRQTGSNMHVFLDVYAKQTAEAGKVYMITRNTYAWRMADIADAAMAWWNATYPDKAITEVSYLTEEMCNLYVKSDAFPSRARKNPDGEDWTLLDPDHISEKGDAGFHSDFDGLEPFFRQDYYYTMGSGLVENVVTTKDQGGLRTCEKASYNAYGYVAGRGAYYYQDSCLLLDYVPTITKTVVQTDESGSSKSVFSMDSGQRFVDYALQPGLGSMPSVGDAEGETTKTITLVIKDVLPDKLSYVTGSAYWGGTYTQAEDCKQAGTVTGGVELTPTISVIPADDPEFPDDEGKTLLTFSIDVTVDLSNTQQLQIDPIYFSCTIGQVGSENDVNDQEYITNKATIRDKDADLVAYSAEKGNLSSTTFQISKMANYAISKVATTRILETTENPTFTLTFSNPSDYPLENQIIVDELPYDSTAEGFNATSAVSYYGTDIQAGWFEIEKFYVGAAEGPEKAAELIAGLEVYYSGTAQKFRDYTASQWVTDLITVDEGNSWGKRELDTTQTYEIDGVTYYSLAENPTLNGRSVTYMALVGTVPANTTLKIYVELKMNSAYQPHGGDTLVNYMHKYVGTAEDTTELISSDWVQYTERTLEGVTWIDSNGNGMKDISEESLPELNVSLLKLKDGGTASNIDDYEPVTLADGSQVVIPVGKEISLQAASLEAAVDYVATSAQNWADARYRFRSVPAGTYAVIFTDPEGKEIIKPMFATAANYTGVADTLDSDGVPVYNDNKTELYETRILGIQMPEASQLQYGLYQSQDHDSGFYNRGYILPETGGTGTQMYTWGGALLIAASAVALLYKPKRRREDRGAP